MKQMEDVMKAGDTKANDKVRLACGCIAMRTTGPDKTSEPTFRIIENHCAGHDKSPFVILKNDDEVRLNEDLDEVLRQVREIGLTGGRDDHYQSRSRPSSHCGTCERDRGCGSTHRDEAGGGFGHIKAKLDERH